MKVRVTSRGTIDELEGNEFSVELPTQFVGNVTFAATPSQSITTVTSNSTVSHYMTLVNASNGNITTTLPNAITYEGKQLNIKKIDSSGYTVSINTTSNQTIDGQSTLTITSQWTTLSVIAHDGGWYIT